MTPEQEDELIKAHRAKRPDCVSTEEEQEELNRGFQEFLTKEKEAGRATRREDLL
jgi:hypothetical protein